MTAVRRRIPSTFVAAVALTLCLLPLGQASADEFVRRVNAPLAEIRAERRSDVIVLPAMAKMDKPPLGVDTPAKARLAPVGGSAWSAAVEWASADAQRAVIDAVHKVTQATDWREAMGFGQPYGLAELGTSPEQIALISARLYTDLGDPPLLAAARQLYLPVFEDVTCLYHVEATRLLAEGRPADAANALVDWLFFARQIADREFKTEIDWALRTMIDVLERVRDVIYMDFRDGRRATAGELVALVKRLEEQRGPLGIDRIQLPPGDAEAARQLVAFVMQERGRVRPEVYAQTMSRLATTERPLRLFGESARWSGGAGEHANWFDTTEHLNAIVTEFGDRWSRSWHDPVLREPPMYNLISRRHERWAVILESYPNMRSLFEQRQLLRVEAVGTRHALALLAFRISSGGFPRDIAAARPHYIERIEADPFNPDRARGREPPLEFFVPMRDTAGRFGEREQVQPHTINVLSPDAPNLAIRLRDDQFVLYSVGADGGRNWAEEVQNTIDAPSGRDYLIWPPVLSLVRQELMQTGQLR
ncbi:MAG: hypothetical protein KIS87_09585 [Phycisphaeraceae bacterium]|nr:hypothetical protein [Phycisphaeraceae bacterium]